MGESGKSKRLGHRHTTREPNMLPFMSPDRKLIGSSFTGLHCEQGKQVSTGSQRACAWPREGLIGAVCLVRRDKPVRP